ncbi:MAG: DUF5106 domain-containing protein [Bacteroidales bacterium]|nr:DUF5106 domain-containing protein [Bacteroidales bacterium]
MKKFFVILTLLAGLSACQTPERGPQPFPNAEPPIMLVRSTEEMANWIADHYWDAWLDSLDCFSADTSLVGGILFEDFQNAANQYAILLSAIPAQKAVHAQNRLWNKLSDPEFKHPRVAEKLFMAAEILFYNPISDWRNEEFYLPALSWKLQQHEDEMVLERYREQQRICQLNRLGEVAADFEYQVPGKEVQRMHNLRTPYTLLFFSNPECPVCEEIIGSFMASDVLNQAIETQQLTLLNLYIDQELDRWMNYRHHFPKTWINAFDPNFSLRDNDRYAIRAIPSLYLLDSEKRVLLKDATPQQVVRALQSMR